MCQEKCYSEEFNFNHLCSPHFSLYPNWTKLCEGKECILHLLNKESKMRNIKLELFLLNEKHLYYEIFFMFRFDVIATVMKYGMVRVF